MTKKYQFGTCGLCCDICFLNNTKFQESAEYIIHLFEDPMLLGILSMNEPNFKEKDFPVFKNVLEIISKFPPCPGCDKRDACSIRECASEKKVENCSECNFFDVNKGICSAPPKPPKLPFLPPAPIFLAGLAKRYKNWNIENLKAFAKGKQKEIESQIEELIKNGKTSHDFIDFSVNLFDMKP